MKTTLTLLDDGPPFFFLGDPNKLILSLTYQNPGPQEVDFSVLPLPDQKKVLTHVLAGQVESSVSYDELYGTYQKIFSQDAPAVPESQKPAQKPAGADQKLKIPQTYLEKEEKFQAKCKKLVKKSFKHLKAELIKANNARMLRIVRDLELQKKSPRVSVLNFIEVELRKLDRAIVESIENDTNPVTIKAGSSLEGETFVSDVIESEQETIQFTPEMLIGQETK